MTVPNSSNIAAIPSHTFQTPRLLLRPFTPANAELLVALDSDAETMRWINGGVTIARDEILTTSVPKILAAADPSRGIGFYTAFLRETGEPIGWVHLRHGFHWKEELELGYRFLRSTWNQGYATEACRAVLEFAFNTLNAPKVIATTMRQNEASQRVMRKLGMTFETEFEETRWPGPDKRAMKYSISRPPCR